MTASVRGGDKLAKTLEDLGKQFEPAAVKVGFIDGAMYSAEEILRRRRRFFKALNIATKVPEDATAEPLPVAQAAFWDEYGTVTSKPRPFMRNTVEARASAWKDAVVAFAKSPGATSIIVLQKVGELMKDDFVRAIKEWPADNAELTIKIKGFNQGLVDAGIMQLHVGYELIEGVPKDSRPI